MKKLANEKLLTGKNIIITGASTGIGKALGIGFTELGANVGLIARSEHKLAENVKEIENKGKKDNSVGKAVYAVADVTKYQQIENAFRSISEKLGDIHVLVNNAGIAPVEFQITSPHQIDEVIDTNLKGMFYASFAIIPYFEKVKRGSIINTSSVAALNNWDGANPLYDATKAGINRFTTSLNTQFKTRKIRINAILPTWIETPMLAHIPPSAMKSMVDAMKMPMLKPEELVPYYVFFASDKSKLETGCLVNIAYFWKTLDYIKRLPPEQSHTWADLEPLIQKEFSYPSYINIKENRKLLEFLLTFTYP